jgi:hypothetical protein
MRRILNNDTAFSLLRAGTALGFTLFICVVMLRPELQTIAGIPILKIAAQYHVSLLGHVFTFALLFTLWCWALIPHFRASAAPFIALLIVMTLGTMGEFLQMFIAGRYASAADMIANGAGIVLAWWMWRTLSLTVTRRYATLLCPA